MWWKPPLEGTWVIFCWVCAADFSEPLPMLWPIIDSIFAHFWTRPEWNGGRLLNIKIRQQPFYHESSCLWILNCHKVGVVFVSFISLDKVSIVDFTLASTLITLPLIDNCLPLGGSCININGKHGDINLSSKGVKFKHSGFAGNSILLAFEQTGNFPSLRFEWQVEQIHSVSSTLVVPVTHVANWFFVPFVYLIGSHFITDDRNQIWSQQAPIYLGPNLMLRFNERL